MISLKIKHKEKKRKNKNPPPPHQKIQSTTTFVIIQRVNCRFRSDITIWSTKHEIYFHKLI